jgi:hypothetical protein
VVTVQAAVAITQQAPMGGCGQGLVGVQAVTAPFQLLGGAQLTWVVTEQAPVLGLQHVPWGGCGQGFGVQVTPAMNVVPAAHSVWKLAVQAPVSGVQHAPWGTGTHGLAAQVLPWVQTLVPVQLTRMVSVQAPASVQQVPLGGWGQLLVGVQVDVESQVLVPVQLTWIVVVQAPVVGLQQEPCGGCGQGLVGVHPEAPEMNVFAAAHCVWKTNEHAPVEGTQQAPWGTTGQGLGLQTPPLVQVLVPVQVAAGVTVHPPLRVQQEPWGGWGQGLVGVQDWLAVQTLVPVQLTWMVTLHPPVEGMQQVPVGGWGQGLGLQMASCVHVKEQLAWVVTEQAPVEALQQEPEGGRQGLGGPQVRPPVHVLPAAHPFWKTTTHPPTDVQHVPVGGQVNVAHVCPAVNEEGKAHAPVEVTSVHVPAVEQHAPAWAWARPVHRASTAIARQTIRQQLIQRMRSLRSGPARRGAGCGHRRTGDRPSRPGGGDSVGLLGAGPCSRMSRKRAVCPLPGPKRAHELPHTCPGTARGGRSRRGSRWARGDPAPTTADLARSADASYCHAPR